MKIVSLEDIQNECGFLVTDKLGCTPKEAEVWVRDREREVLNHIGDYAWGGAAQVNFYLSNRHKFEIIKECVLSQIRYIARHNFVTPSEIMEKDKAYNMYGVAPEVHKTLANNGLLNTGVWNCEIDD